MYHTVIGSGSKLATTSAQLLQVKLPTGVRSPAATRTNNFLGCCGMCCHEQRLLLICPQTLGSFP